MNKKWMPLALVIVLGVLLLVIKQCQKKNEPEPKPKVTNNTKKDPSSNVNRNRGFDRRISYLEYSEHAKCRMSCRHISQSEVEDIMQNGTINYNKSEIQNARCPRYALEGITQDNQRVRIVFAQCDYKTEVVTVIDLGREWSCDCPGDENKYKNKN
ncbi:MAG: DUF4258 domain-containing protein [Bacteroidetes bacterium]|nr:DUF4258 domain-containing protein [Bacteroidota bacterium]